MKTKLTLLITLVLSLPSFASASTFATSSPVASTVWTKDQSPYIVNAYDFNVPTGVTLTIQPGVVIKFSQNNIALTVNGTLNAQGTAADPIYFTSYNDKTVGGDTGTSPWGLSWAGIQTNSGASVNVSNVNIRNANNALTNNGGTATISNSTFENDTNGAYHTAGTTNLSQNIFQNDQKGIRGLGTGSLSFTGNTFLNDAEAGYFDLSGGMTFTNSNNTVSGTGRKGFFIYSDGTNGSDQTLSGDNIPYVVDVFGITVPAGKTLAIQSGAIIKFEQNNASIIVNGALNVSGTKDQPVYFTPLSDDTIGGDTDGGAAVNYDNQWASIKLNAGATANFSHAVLRKGGYFTGTGAVTNNGATLTVSDSEISGSANFGVLHNSGTTNISNSAITGNQTYGIYNNAANTVLAQNNWWGSATGPKHATNPLGTGDKVTDKVNFTPWLAYDPTKAPVLTPVLFIPGTLGTELKKGNQLLWLDIFSSLLPLNSHFMDPLAFNLDGTPFDPSVVIGNVLDNPSGQYDYTSGFVSEMLSRGYSTSTNLFLFPYDWRADISNNADVALKNKIEAIVAQTGTAKIDLVAHSQGGLLLKKFLLDHPEYDSKIRKIVFLGTPNLGSPKSAQTLLNGDDLSVALKLGGVTWLHLDPSEVQRISQNMPAIYEMLPSQEYFAETHGYLASWKWPLFGFPYADVSDYAETRAKLIAAGLNPSLIALAETFHTGALDDFSFAGTGIEAWNIVGCNTATFTQVTDNGTRVHVLDYDAGDGTVPLVSALHLSGAHTLYELTADHASMPSDPTVRGEVADILTGQSSNRPGIAADASQCRPVSGSSVSVHSPADLNVYDPQGRHLGTNADGSFDLQIPGATYDTIGEEKFAFLPTLPNGQNYTVKLVATGTGTMSFVSSQVENGTTVNTSAYYDIPVSVGVTANAVLNSDNSQNLALQKADGTSQNILPNTGTGETLPDTLAPQTTATPTGTSGQNGWYTSDVTVTFNATDLPVSNPSGVKDTFYSTDGKTWATTTPLVISAEGTTTVQFYSTDNAGNKEATSTLQIKIDKTAPEAKVSVDATTKDLKVEGVDISPTTLVKNTDNSYTITNLAGHTTKLFFQKTYFGKLLTYAKLTGIQYDSAIKVTLPSSSFLYLWNILANPQTLLSQTIVVNDTYGIEALFDAKKNVTTVLLKKKGVQIQSQTCSGLRIPKLTTGKGTVGYEI